MDDSTTLEAVDAPDARSAVADEVLAIAWSAEETDRVAQVAFFEESGAARVLGWGSSSSDPAGRVQFFEQRPGSRKPAPPLQTRFLSREQLCIRGMRGALEVERIGRCPMLMNGIAVERCTLRPGDTLILKDQLLSVRHLVGRAARSSPELAARFMGRLADGTEAAAVRPELIE